MGISAEALQRELRAVFADEACDSLTRVETLIERQRRAPADAGLLDALFREFHTMKVGAAAAGLPQAASELHAAESLLDAARAGQARLGEAEAIASLRRAVECVRRAVGEPVAPDAPGGEVRLETLWPPLSYATAVAAAMEHKFVALHTAGGDVVVERGVADALRRALLHLVRNAVAHGIEPPEARHAAGKPRVGCVLVGVAPGADGLTVTVADDGAGLDVAAITVAARRRGLIAAEAVPTARELTRVLCHPGFTTRAQPTELAGRGVGLDAVADTLRGAIDVESRAGAGCTVRLHVPA
jgi:chemotaxis protein histidine kinase CheA